MPCKRPKLLTIDHIIHQFKSIDCVLFCKTMLLNREESNLGTITM